MEFRYSAIQCAYQCLKKYELQYVKGIKSKESSNLEFGQAIHTGISAHYEGLDPIQVFNAYWNIVKEKTLVYQRLSWQELSQAGQALLERWVRLHAKHYVPFKIEEAIKFKVGEYGFTGTPDFVGTYKGKRSIVDWKTASKEYDKKQIQVGEQMYIYAHAVKQAYNYDVEQLVYCVFIKNPLRIQTITLDLTQDKLSSMLSNVELMAKDLSHRTEFPLNRNSCLYCDYYSNCYGEVNG